MNRVRYVLVALLTATVLIFAVQNLRAVSVTALFWEVRASVTLIILGPFLVGLVAGVALTLFAKRRAVGGRDLKEGKADGRTSPPTV